MPTRDTVEYSGDRYAVIDAAGTPTVYVMDGNSRGAETTGATKTAVLAELTSSQSEPARGRIDSNPAGVTGADRITNIVSLTTAEYTAATKDNNTLYIITDA